MLMIANKKPQFSTKRLKELEIFMQKLKVDLISKKSTDENNLEFLESINESLIHSSAKYKLNHERLEFLGDAVLRLAASEFIEKKYSNLSVGQRSELRSHLVSDEWLSQVGKNIKIIEVIKLGKNATADKSALSTIEAECTEALIGAIYEWFNDLDSIHLWLEPYWIKTSNQILNDPYNKNEKSHLQEWCQAKGYEIPEYKITESGTIHGDSKKFFCKVFINKNPVGEGWGQSRKKAEKEAARSSLIKLKI
tara:strand:- start:2393 stop:3145 length:753 start_codon:yes stop_codon:yes gene_type:complete